MKDVIVREASKQVSLRLEFQVEVSLVIETKMIRFFIELFSISLFLWFPGVSPAGS